MQIRWKSKATWRPFFKYIGPDGWDDRHDLWILKLHIKWGPDA